MNSTPASDQVGSRFSGKVPQYYAVSSR